MRTTIILNKYDKERGLQSNLDSWIIKTTDTRVATEENLLEEWDTILYEDNSRQHGDSTRQSTITEWLKSLSREVRILHSNPTFILILV